MLNRFASVFPKSKATRSSAVSAQDSASSRAVQLGFIIPPHHCVLVRGGVVAWNQHLWRLITPTLRLGHLGTGGETRPGVGEPLGPATRPQFDSHRWHWHPSPQRLTAWPARHR